MELKINTGTGERLRRAEGIPLHYMPFVNRFSYPRLLTSSYVDILYQQTSDNGYTLRYHYFNVHEPVTLTTTISSPKLCIAAVLAGEVAFKLNESESFSVGASEYVTMYLTTEEHYLSLLPGKHEILRIDFDLEKLAAHGVSYSVPQDWLDTMENSAAIVLSRGDIDDTMAQMISDIKQLPLTAYDETRFFFKKEWKILQHTLRQQNLQYSDD
jgi:hypothetical protein